MPELPSRYTRFEDGENRLRVLSTAIVGWEYWTDDEEGGRKPNRVRTFDELPDEVKEATGRERAKHFWAFVVYNYNDKALQILELTQRSIMKAFEGLDQSKSWGDVREYDLVVKRTKTGPKDRDVEYGVMPEPKKALSKEIKEEFERIAVDLTKLYDGDDPFIESGEALAEEASKKV